MKKFLRSKKVWLGIIVLGSITSLVLYRAYQASKPVALKTIYPSYQDLKQTLDINGSIKADESVSLRFPASSRLTWVGVKTGDRVKQWQAVAKVDTRILEKQLKQDLNTFEKSFRTHDQVLDDYDYYGVPNLNQEVTRILENANFDLQNSVLNVEIRDLSVRLSTLTSPIAGIVTQIDSPIAGVTISPSDIFQIVNPDSLYFAIVIDEEDIGLVEPGQKVEVTLDAFSDQKLAGTISTIDFNPTTSSSGSTAYESKVSLPLDLASGKYRLGLNGIGEVTINEKPQVLTIPLDSLIEREDGAFVNVLVEGESQERTIQTGIITDEWVEVIDGLIENDAVIVPQDEI